MEASGTRLGKGLLLLLALFTTLALRAQALRGTFAAGGGHSLSIHADGTLWVTGKNDHGQLGLGTVATTAVTSWTQVGTDTDWVQVAAGNAHSLALKANGQLYTWGDNAYGQLGYRYHGRRGYPNRPSGCWLYASGSRLSL
jgi:alpha-tubulin suppressor-like RCC1 family protein